MASNIEPIQASPGVKRPNMSSGACIPKKRVSCVSGALPGTDTHDTRFFPLWPLPGRGAALLQRCEDRHSGMRTW